MAPVLWNVGSGGVATLTLNRPEVRNALNGSLLDRMVEVLDQLDRDQAVRALIVTGAGERAFSAGADLAERQRMSSAELTAHTGLIRRVADLLAAFPVPVVAAVRGYALAGGAELALACDMRVASQDAVFGFPEVRWGIFPGAGGPVRLSRLIGPGNARRLLFTGAQLSAAQALGLGLVQEVCHDPMATARDWAEQIAAAGPLAIRRLKSALNQSDGLPPGAAQEVVRVERERLDSSQDYAEGLAAFREKRPPRFQGH